jgi:hypothetical protein
MDCFSENPSGQLVIQIFTAEPLFNPGSCPTLDGYLVSDPVIVNATLATSLTAISAGRRVFVYVSDSCTNGRPTATAIGGVGLMLKRVGATAIVTLTIASTAHGGNSVTYHYDTAGRLRTATYCSGVATACSLDAAGNRITVKATGNSGLPTEDPNGVPDALSFTTVGVQISLGQTVQVKPRLEPTSSWRSTLRTGAADLRALPPPQLRYHHDIRLI